MIYYNTDICKFSQILSINRFLNGYFQLNNWWIFLVQEIVCLLGDYLGSVSMMHVCIHVIVGVIGTWMIFHFHFRIFLKTSVPIFLRNSHNYSIRYGMYTHFHCASLCIHSVIAQLPNGPRKICYYGGANAISQGLILGWSSMRHAKSLHQPRLSPPIHPGISCLFDLSHYVSYLLQAFSSETIMKKKNLGWYYIFTPLTLYTMNTIVTMGHRPMGPAYSQALSLILRYTKGQRLIPQHYKSTRESCELMRHTRNSP